MVSSEVRVVLALTALILAMSLLAYISDSWSRGISVALATATLLPAARRRERDVRPGGDVERADPTASPGVPPAPIVVERDIGRQHDPEASSSGSPSE